MRWKKYFGPSTLIAAAFIGPGTVTVCTLAGAKMGYSLLWVLLFSIFAATVLQEMSARIGVITQQGLGHLLRDSKLKGAVVGWLMFHLMLLTILIGNAAYEAGNLGGAILGANLFFESTTFWAFAIGGVSALLLFAGKYKWIESFLIGLVLLMSLAFLICCIVVKPDLGEILNGFIPRVNEVEDWFLVIGLIGTTVVPYNIFLHSSTVFTKYTSTEGLKQMRIENIIAIALGGLISMLIMIVAAQAGSTSTEIKSAADMAIYLEPAFGSWAKYTIAIGLFSAGISSAITAPLAAAYVAQESFNWPKELKFWKFRLTWCVILSIGILFSVLGYKPIEVIKFAQVLNGFLLPIVAMYLVFLVNKKSLMGSFANSLLRNIISCVVVFISILISFKILNSVFNFI